MSLKILVEEAKLPAPNNLTWIFPVLDDGTRREWRIDSFDLNLWFKEALGRYPLSQSGDRETWSDLKENWLKVKDRFYRELQNQLQLGTTISVEGTRISAADWEAVRELPVAELPPLSEAQREVTKKMRVSETEYARNFLASERSRTALLVKTERLAKFLTEQLKRFAPTASISRVCLSTTDQSFDVEVKDAEASIPVRIREDVVDDLFEGGSAAAEEKIRRILEIAVKYNNRAIQ